MGNQESINRPVVLPREKNEQGMDSWFPHHCDTAPNRSDLRKKRWIFGSQIHRIRSLSSEKAQQLELPDPWWWELIAWLAQIFIDQKAEGSGRELGVTHRLTESGYTHDQGPISQRFHRPPNQCRWLGTRWSSTQACQRYFIFKWLQEKKKYEEMHNDKCTVINAQENFLKSWHL